VSGTFWSVVGNGFGKVFTFIAMILVARILGKEAFGEFGLVRSTAMTFVTFSSFGMGITATKYIAELLHRDKERTGRIIGLTYVFTFFTSLFIAIVFYLISPWLCETQLSKPELTNVMQLGAVLLFLTSFVGTQIAVIVGFQDFRGLANITLISGVLALPYYVIGTYYWGVYGGIVSVIIVTGMNMLLSSVFIWQNMNKFNIRYSIFDSYKECMVLLYFNLPIFLHNSIYVIVNWVSQLLLTKQPNGLAELGIYWAAMNWQFVILFLPQQIISVFLPILSQICKNKTKLFWRTIGRCWLITFSVSLILVLPFLIFPQIFMGLFGNEFTGNWKVLFSVCIFVLVYPSTIISNHLFLCHDRNWTHLFFAAIWLTIYVITFLIMSRKNLESSDIFLTLTISNIIYSILAFIYFYFSKTIR
jgi:O-antigen/teichoic acid export membrane protein